MGREERLELRRLQGAAQAGATALLNGLAGGAPSSRTPAPPRLLARGHRPGLRAACTAFALSLSLVLQVASGADTGPPAAAAPPRDAANAAFWQRWDSVGADPLQNPYEWYQPKVRLAGREAPWLPEAAPAERAFAPRTLDAAAQFAEHTAGQALIVLKDGKVQLERYFGGATADTLFSSHSMARTLNALAVGIAIADGRIASVDDPASKYLPEWRDAARGAITIRQLLTMSGGFRTPPSREPGSAFSQSYYGADLATLTLAARPDVAPGSTFAYDNFHNLALALVLERATGQRYRDFLEQRLWQPLGAGDAEMMLDSPGGRVFPFCCLWSRPRDWARLGQMLLDRGRVGARQVVPAGWVEQMARPSAASANFGYQVFVGSAWTNPVTNRRASRLGDTLAPAFTEDLYYASGAGDLVLMVLPAQRLVVLRVGRDSPAWRDQAIPNLLLGELGLARPGGWDWVYPWRGSLRSGPPPQVSILERNPLNYWPAERVAGRPSAPLPRRASQCLAGARLEPALALLRANGTRAFLLWRDGAIEAEWYAEDFDRGQRIESASMHKSVLALAVGAAVAGGQVRDVRQRVDTWLTEWRGDPRGAITLEQLLTMSSGLAPYPFELKFGTPSHRFTFGTDLEEVPLKLELKHRPGLDFDYSSAVSQLVALVLERATGRRYADFVAEALWQPLGADDAFVTLDRPGGHPRASASWLARPEDWVRLGRLVLDEGRYDGRRVLPRRWIRAMSAPSAANPNYGYQLWRGSPWQPQRRYNRLNPTSVPAAEPFLADDVVYFDGAGAQRVYVIPSRRMVIVRMGAPDANWDDSRLPNLLLRAYDADCGRGG
jgi:CubicO group peptidase (beta-lactamase class C family)